MIFLKKTGKLACAKKNLENSAAREPAVPTCKLLKKRQLGTVIFIETAGGNCVFIF